MLLVSVYVLFWPRQGGATLFEHSDKVVHAVLFGLLAVTTRWRFGGRPALLAAVAAYAVLSEVVQGVLLPERSGDALDVVADLVGAAVGWAALRRR